MLTKRGVVRGGFLVISKVRVHGDAQTIVSPALAKCHTSLGTFVGAAGLNQSPSPGLGCVSHFSLLSQSLPVPTVLRLCPAWLRVLREKLRDPEGS